MENVYAEKLRVGDIITLEHAKPYEGFLSVETVINSECVLKTCNIALEDCLWQVCVQHQYSSTVEYEAALINEDEDKDSDNEENLEEQISKQNSSPAAESMSKALLLSKSEQKKNQLQRAAATENKLNKKLMSMKYGKPVAFGEVIQLLNIKSQTFLTVSSTMLARQERENLQVYFDGTGNTMSWLEFMPRFKYDREGQQIPNETETYIRVHERSSEYIHAARKASKYAVNNAKEINCSLESSCWKISIYSKASDAMTKNILLGNLVTLQEPEASTYLTLDSRKNSNCANVVMSSSMQLSFSASDCNVGTNLLWMLEGEDMFQGGVVSNHGSNIALRDLNSGLYMKMSEGGVTAVKNREECSFFELSTSQPADIGSSIADGTIVQLSCQKEFVGLKKSQNGKLHCEGCADRSSALSMVVTSKLQQTMGVDLIAGVEATVVVRRFERLIRTKEMFLLPKPLMEFEIRKYFSCIDFVSEFLQPHDALAKTSSGSNPIHSNLEMAETVVVVIRQTMLREQGFLSALLNVIEHCALGTMKEFSNSEVRSISFLQRGYSEPVLSHSKDDSDDFDSSEEQKVGAFDIKADLFAPKKNVGSRQSFAGDSPSNKEAMRKKMRLSFLAAAAQMKLKDGCGESSPPKGDSFTTLVKAAKYNKDLQKSNASTKRHTSIQSHSPSLSSNLATFSSGDAKVIKTSDGFKTTLSSEISKASLEVLHLAILENHTSQITIGDYFSVLLNQVRYHREAILCVQEFLKDNLQMLQTKIRDREMKIFLDQLLSIEMNVTLINLLRSSCTCPGGVDNTQRMVVNALFHREILFLKKSSVEKTVGLWRSNSFMQRLRPGTVLAKENDVSNKADTAIIVSDNRQSLAKLKLQQAAKNAIKVKGQAAVTENSKRSVLISISEKPNVVRHVSWTSKRMYFPKSSAKFEEDVLGNHILKYGIPDLVVNWFTKESSDEDFSSLTLFGYASDTPFNAFFPVTLIHDSDDALAEAVAPPPSSPPSYSHSKSPQLLTSKASSKRMKRMNIARKKTIAKRRSQVVEYFISQMYLVADLCLDRNYIAIALLEKFYTFGMLLTVLKTRNCPPAIQAPVVRIIRCLYVDREPQVEAKFPHLIKTSISLKGGNESTFEYFHSGSPFKFGLLQLILSDYLRNKLDIANCDELSSESIELVLCLMKYGYYFNVEQLQDIIHPLVEALLNQRLGESDDLHNILSIDSDDSGEQSEHDDLFYSELGNKEKSVENNMKKSEKKHRSSPYKFNGNLSSRPAKVTPLTDNSSEIDDKLTPAAKLGSLATKIFLFLESLKVLVFVLCLVVVTTTFSVLGFFSDRNQAVYGGFDLFVSIFFVTELTLRMSCYRIAKGEISTFFSSYLNALDLIIVVFDLILLSLDPQYFGYAAKFAKALKVIRIVRLFRVFRAARLLKTIAEKSATHAVWTLPQRYSKISEHEVRTIAGILRILRMANDRIEDKKLSTIFSAYIEWKGNWSQLEEEAKTITNRLMEELRDEGALIPPKIDEALTDIVMYSSPVLVKEALDLLRVLKSEDYLLKKCLLKMQIISSASSEQKYHKIIENLQKMKKYAETFEIWGSLKNEDHLSIANELLQMTSEISDMITNPAAPNFFDLNGVAVVDNEVQCLLSNLDALKDMMSIQLALLDASIIKMDPIIERIIVSCNDLICAFVCENNSNQMEAFKHISWFLKKVDDVPSSAKVVRAMVSGNRNLIKQVPHRHIAEFFQKIVSNGKQPEYLELFVGLTDVEDTGDGSISQLRNEISRFVTNTERSSNMLLWCCSRGSKAYEARVSAMEPFGDVKFPPSEKELSSDLQYHLNLLQLLVGCKLGPKIQAVYPLDDIVSAILDDRTIFHVKNKLAYILQGMISSNTEAIEASESLWLFFENVVEFFEEAESEFPLYSRHDSKKVSKLARAHYCEWMRICVSCISLFFSGFDLSLFRDACEIDESSLNITRRNEEDIMEIITNLHDSANKIVLKYKKGMSQQCVETFEHVLVTLSEFLKNDTDHLGESLDVRDRHDRVLRSRQAQVNREASLAEDVQQVLTRRKFQEFVKYISVSSHEMHEPSIHTFLNLPVIAATVDSDVRFEAFLLRVTNYIRSQITKASNASMLNKEVYPSAIWVLQTLRLILEGKISCNVGDLADPLKLIDETISTTWYHSVMNSCGVTYMCMDLTAIGIETALTVEAMKLLIVLLTKNGGNYEIQETMHRYLSDTDSTLFFEQMKEIIEVQISWCSRFNVDIRKKYHLSLNEPRELTDEVYSLKLLSAMCDGHFPLKLIMKEQNGNSRFVNIVDQLAHFAETISRMEGHTCTKLAIRVIHTVYVLMQGPCSEIQEHFVLHADLLTALNRFLKTSRPSRNFSVEWVNDIESLKEFAIDVLRVSIERQPSDSVVVERIKTTIDISLLSVLILPVTTDEEGNSLKLGDLTRLQAKYLVFLQALDDYDIEMPFNATERIDEDIAFVEVMWQGELTVHYFHVPEIAKDLSERSKSIIIADMNCLSQELKLKDFLKKATVLYREATHQMYLKSFGVSNIWHFIDTVSRLMYANVIVMNTILIARYVEDSSGNIYLPPETRNVLLGLNVIQCIMSFNVVVISLFVRLPVIYSTYTSTGVHELLSLFYALTDFLQVWYFVYFGVTLLAIFKSYLFLSLLLLDFIVLDATSRDVLYAVVIPARQLFSTFIIMMIVLYITAVVIFVFFRNDYLSFEDDNNTMWVSVVLAFNYGIRATEGLGQYMFDTTGIRLLVDTTIYFILVVILRNIFFGIIINTFGELRNIKKEREEHVSNRCFICGIDRHEYDKMNQNDQTDFKYHRQQTHNMWNYLYFVVKIWYQPRSQDTSLEQYVRFCMENDDTNWFPVGVMGYMSSTVDVGRGKASDPYDRKQKTLNSTDDKLNDTANQLKVFNKINEKLTIMERQGTIGETSSRHVSFTKASPSNSTIAFKSNLERKSSAQNVSTAETVFFVETTVRNETSSLQTLLKQLKNSIDNCAGKLEDIESSTKKPQRLAGIRIPNNPERAVNPVIEVDSPISNGGIIGRSSTPGPSLSFLTAKK